MKLRAVTLPVDAIGIGQRVGERQSVQRDARIRAAVEGDFDSLPLASCQVGERHVVGGPGSHLGGELEYLRAIRGHAHQSGAGIVAYRYVEIAVPYRELPGGNHLGHRL